jgi:hypothetical protein
MYFNFRPYNVLNFNLVYGSSILYYLYYTLLLSTGQALLLPIKCILSMTTFIVSGILKLKEFISRIPVEVWVSLYVFTFITLAMFVANNTFIFVILLIMTVIPFIAIFLIEMNDF